jgi:hypothetical protein
MPIDQQPQPMRFRRTIPTLAAALVLLSLTSAACSSSPPTPENTVINYLVAVDRGDKDGAQGYLCSRLRKSVDAEESATLNRIGHAQVFGEGLRRKSRNSATVLLRVIFPPSSPGAQGEPWEARLVREGSSWRVCGFAPSQQG